MLIAVVRGAPSTLLGIPALLAIGARAEGWLVLTGTAVAILLAGAFRWLVWTRFTYAMTADAVVIESGVFSRNRRTIPYERVADVGIERRLLQRMFGLAKVTLETGGVGADEGLLDSVSIAEAERLRVLLRQRGAVAQQDVPLVETSKTTAVTPTSLPLFSMSARRVLIYGLFNFSLVWVAVGVGAFQYLDGSFGFDVRDSIEGALFSRRGALELLPATALAGVIALGVAVVLGAGVVAGLCQTTLREHGFTLTSEDRRLRRTRGLFTQSDAIIALPRVQLAVIDDGFFRRLLGWSRLRAQVMGGEGAKGRQDLAPLARADEVERLLTTLRLKRADPADMLAVSRGHIGRSLLRRITLPVLLILGCAFMTPLALLATPLLLPLIATALLNRRYHRYRLDQEMLQVQRGVLGRETWIAPLARVQVVTLRRSWLQRQLRVATVLVDTAGGTRLSGPNIHDVREENGWAIVGSLCRP
jgi:putative membrane protein